MQERHNITVVQTATRPRPKRAAGFLDESDNEDDRNRPMTEHIIRGETVDRSYQGKDRPGDICAQRPHRPQQDERYKSPSSFQSKLPLQSLRPGHGHVGTTSTARSTKGVNVNRLRELLGKKEQMPVIDGHQFNDQPRLDSESPKTAARGPLRTETEHRRFQQSQNRREIKPLLSSQLKAVHRYPSDTTGPARTEHNQRSNGLSRYPMHGDNAKLPFEEIAMSTTNSTRNPLLSRTKKSEPARVQLSHGPADSSRPEIVAQGRQRHTEAGCTSSHKKTNAIQRVAALFRPRQSNLGGSLTKPSMQDNESLGDFAMRPKMKTEAMSQQQSQIAEPGRSHRTDSNVSKETAKGLVSQQQHSTHGYSSKRHQTILGQPNSQPQSVARLSKGSSGLTSDITRKSANGQRLQPSVSRQLKYTQVSPKPPSTTLSGANHTSGKRNAQQISGGPSHSGRPSKKPFQSLRDSNDPRSSESRVQRPVESTAIHVDDIVDMNAISSQDSKDTSQTISFDHPEEDDEVGPPRTQHNGSLNRGVILHGKTPRQTEYSSSRLERSQSQGEASAGLQRGGKTVGQNYTHNKIMRPSALSPTPASRTTPPNTPKRPAITLSAISSNSIEPVEPYIEYQDIDVENLAVMKLGSPPPLSEDIEPFFEFSIFQEMWSDNQKVSEFAAYELTSRPFIRLEEANSRAEKHFASIRQQYEQNFAVKFVNQTMTLDRHGCYIIAGAFSHVGHPGKQVFVKIWVQRDYVSELSNVAPHKLSLTPFISKTVYALRLVKIVPLITDAPDSESDSDSDTDSEQDDQSENEAENPNPLKKPKSTKGKKESKTNSVNTLRVLHPIPCAEIYTTLEAANAAAETLQIELSHEKKPKDYQLLLQQNDSVKLGNNLMALNYKGALWKTSFKTPGFNGSNFELAVERTTLCGPRNL